MPERVLAFCTTIALQSAGKAGHDKISNLQCRVRPYEAFVSAQRLRVMETLARMAVFTVLISGVTLVNARADDTSVYVAGKAKYCKETVVSGYLDCFYASLDACQKHYKSTNIRCVANPNSGT